MDYSLNDYQRRLVEEHLNVIDKVICKCVFVNSSVCGLEYDDLYQVGAIGLCKAAVRYQTGHGAVFETYAYRVVKNAILDHLKSVLKKRDAYASFMADAEVYAEQLYSPAAYAQEHEKLVALALAEIRERYTDTTKKGIDAMVLKMQGYSSSDIARKYQVKPNYIGACISRAKKCLKKDEELLEKITGNMLEIA